MATVLTTAGKGITTNRIKGSGTEPNYVAWGTDSTTAVVADTALGTESAEARVAGTSSRVTTTVANDTYQAVGTITSESSQTIAEVGLLDASAAGNLFIHGDFTGVPVGIGESIAFTIKAVFA